MQEDNIRSLNVNQMIDLLSTAYISLIRNGTSFSAFPSVMLWGPPGVGKSQGVRQIAERITAETGRTVAITDVRLFLLTLSICAASRQPTQTRRLPFGSNRKFFRWTSPQRP